MDIELSEWILIEGRFFEPILGEDLVKKFDELAGKDNFVTL